MASGKSDSGHGLGEWWGKKKQIAKDRIRAGATANILTEGSAGKRSAPGDGVYVRRREDRRAREADCPPGRPREGGTVKNVRPVHMHAHYKKCRERRSGSAGSW